MRALRVVVRADYERRDLGKCGTCLGFAYLFESGPLAHRIGGHRDPRTLTTCAGCGSRPLEDYDMSRPRSP